MDKNNTEQLNILLAKEQKMGYYIKERSKKVKDKSREVSVWQIYQIRLKDIS